MLAFRPVHAIHIAGARTASASHGFLFVPAIYGISHFRELNDFITRSSLYATAGHMQVCSLGVGTKEACR